MRRDSRATTALPVFALLPVAALAAPPAFVEHTLSSNHQRAISIVAPDLNNDGHLDIAAVGMFDGAITWFQHSGQTTPSFTRRSIHLPGLGGRALASADLDGDGDTDLLCATSPVDQLIWLENTPTPGGGIAFNSHVITPDSQGADAIALADLDGDGDIDVVIGGQFGVATLRWFENRIADAGPTAFVEHVVPCSATRALRATIADVDTDGRPDLIVSSEHENSSLAWFENDGATPPGFVERTLETVPDGIRAALAVDLDLDGDTDILTARFLLGETAWLENVAGANSAPLFQRRVVSTLPQGPSALATADIDADGDLDVLVASYLDHKLNWLQHFPSPSGPSFVRRVIDDFAPIAESVHVADINADGRLDVLSAVALEVAWYQNAFVPCPGDLNGDDAVNFADLNLVLAFFGQTGPVLPGDANGDGVVNFADLNIVLAFFDAAC